MLSSSSSSSFAIPFFFVIILCSTEGLVKLPDNESVPAVIVFGDSIVDPGNNNNLLTIAKSNYPPYGRDFIGGTPTGRFTNGKIPSDFVGHAPTLSFFFTLITFPLIQTSIYFEYNIVFYRPSLVFMLFNHLI